MPAPDGVAAPAVIVQVHVTGASCSVVPSARITTVVVVGAVQVAGAA